MSVLEWLILIAVLVAVLGVTLLAARRSRRAGSVLASKSTESSKFTERRL